MRLNGYRVKMTEEQRQEAWTMFTGQREHGPFGEDYGCLDWLKPDM